MLLRIPCRANYITYMNACANPYFLSDFLSPCSFFSMSLVNLSRHPRPFSSTLLLSELKTSLRIVANSSHS